ncbi:predicted protein [Nematostella vectensis]|uniref:G-protein coupled receptors family 1 profile domain-containing protein n=1 Tax=Nematostella vectensis TaxID=45351 RepID=A7S169_NEMVE|nr:melanopsin-A [Nematostella vectensis]XP_032239957.1 melanopsin-A [Nematostella vectensis]XP_032239958.1 melanopsin-A [Nematostella vectensis]XP_032239959.1 melanopsin-A [Nematostella vectensis]XP_032239960.1 melanopsin-A [Nematostella vectensis]XP_032239961.1 melanopsin-A [Nematostella vectensis]XP_032239962.1 melanopsin-A [Nematostella vectensis]XP_032239963.1 melanopsin-A [Nematostella vectensis]XP_048585200.1 melanopsin-A [Nematostella vectensis]EDO42547.1 predicted protein [Nematost|eukprot:XP_001634610.1 predicted protein [Nematostella vectensis]
MENTSLAGDPLNRHEAQFYIEMFLGSLILFLSVLGNSLVVYVVNKDPSLKSTTNLLIQNLSMTDIAMATTNMPFWLISLYHGRWIFPQFVCDLDSFTMFAFGSASILTMAVIALNRYFKVVKANKYKRLFGSRKVVWVYCAATWLVGMMFATPPLYGWGLYEYHIQFSTCSLIWDLNRISFVIVFIGVFVNSVTITIFVCYYKIYKTVKITSHNLASHGGTAEAAARVTEIKVMKSTFAVVCCYLICWMPVSFVCVTETAGGVMPREVYAVVIFLMYISSCINPLIYGIMNPQFRRAFLAVARMSNFTAATAASANESGNSNTSRVHIAPQQAKKEAFTVEGTEVVV